MSVLVDVPVEVVWSEAAGPMTVAEDPSWVPAPLAEPDVELLWRWSAERAPAPVVEDWRLDWAVPGVPRFGDAPGRPGAGLAPSPEVAAYAAAVEGLAACDPVMVPPAQALVDLQALLSADEHGRRVRLARMRDAHVRKLAAIEDEVSLQTWARKRFDDVPRDDIATAALLRPFAWLWARVPTGQVPVEAARLAGRALKKLRPHVDRPDGRIDGQPASDVMSAVVGHVVPLIAQARLGLALDGPLLATLQEEVAAILASSDGELGKLERAFTLLAGHVPLRHLPSALAEQVDALLPTSLEEHAERARARRTVRLDPEPLGITIRPDDELYELMHTVLSAAVARDPENPSDTEARRQVRQQHETAVDGAHLERGDVEADNDVRFPRSRGERLHDALKLVLQRYLGAGLAGSRDKAPVSITVTLPLEKLEKAAGTLPAVGGSGRRLPASLVGRWWCDATVTGLVLTPGWIPLGATHPMRTLTALERRASRVQQGQACAGLRCCTPHDPLVVLVPHHVHGFAKNGKTCLAETVWLCPRLHDAVHRGHTVRLRDGRWLTQDGWCDAPTRVAP